MKQVKHIEVILKTVERCNINCTYCYFFHGGDESYKKHPPYISRDTIESVAHFLKNACINHGTESVQIDFHGGEPMMQKKHMFAYMCDVFEKEISPLAELNFVIQTNGMLVTPAWIDLFEKYDVSVGISLDGPKEINDTARLDKKGKGTYDRVIKGLSLLQKAANNGRIRQPSVLSVINPAHSAKESYDHFVNQLQFKNIDFLLPDLSHDAFKVQKQIDGFTPIDYGEYLCDIFDEWTSEDDSSLSIRILRSIVSLFLGGQTQLIGVGEYDNESCAFTISSGGDIQPDDTLRSASPSLMDLNLNTKTHSFNDLLTHPTMLAINDSMKHIPNSCQACPWKNICSGGSGVHRFSKEKGFDNASSMCKALELIHEKVFHYLMNHGVKDEVLKKSMGLVC